MPRATLRKLVLASALLALLTTTCRRPESRTVGDLVATFALADARAEVAHIDFGSAAAHPFLTAGWGAGDKAGNYLWALGERSALRFFIATPRPMELVAAVRSYPPAGPQTVHVWLNGQLLNSFTPGPKLADFRLTITAEALHRGDNELVLEHAASAVPRAVQAGSSDHRALAAAWHSLALSANHHDYILPTARPRSAPPSLILPPASRLDYYLDLPPNSWLSLAGLTTSGDAGPPPKTTLLLADAQGDLSEIPLPSTSDPTEIRLPASGQLRLSLIVEPAGSNNRVLLRPRIETTEPAPSKLPPSAANTSLRDPPNILLYVIDTLRSDHLGCYGYSRPTSPRIDAWARQATLFRRSYAQSSWTRASMVSILSGLQPAVHGTLDRDDGLATTLDTLPARLQAAGYSTAGLITNGNANFGDRGYDHYRYLREQRNREVHQLSDALHNAALDWLDQRPRDRPFFLYIHASDPHAPYEPRSPFRELFARQDLPAQAGGLEALDQLQRTSPAEQGQQRADLIDLYDAEIAMNDHHFGGLLDALESRGLGNTMVLLVSDHGEEFLDHGGWQHGKTLYGEQLRVPLIIRFPEGRHAGVETDITAQHVDIAPTILRAAGLALPASGQGRDLARAIALKSAAGSTAGSAPVPAYAHLALDGIRLQAITTQQHRLIRRRHDFGAAELELYDLSKDPSERHRLGAEAEFWRGYNLSLLRQTDFDWPTALEPGRAEIPAETRERLEALGYL